MIERRELLPGVYLCAEQSDKFKTCCMSVNFLRPLCREEASLNALLPSVLLRGTKAHPGIMQISMLLDELYGANVGTLVRRRGEVQTCGFYSACVEDAFTLGGENIFSGVCAFLRELLFEPELEDGAFVADYVEGEKINLCNTIASEINDKRSYAVMAMLRRMCSEERHGIPRLGYREDVEAITPASLYEHYRKVLATSRVELFYLGRKDVDTVAAELKALLAGLPREALTPVTTEVRRTAETARECTEALDVAQGKLTMGFRTGCIAGEPEYAALHLLNAVFGGCITSKLFVNVRERMSLCYYASSSLEKFKGLMIVSSGIEFDKFTVARDEILRQLEECRCGNITDEELEHARASLLSGIKASMDSPGSIDDFYLGQAILGLGDTLEDRMEAVRAVTKDEVVAAARRLSLDTVYFLKGVEA